jgi:hypothetical protein
MAGGRVTFSNFGVKKREYIPAILQQHGMAALLKPGQPEPRSAEEQEALYDHLVHLYHRVHLVRLHDLYQL